MAVPQRDISLPRDARGDRELRALLTLAGAVASVNSLDDVIETAAEETRSALGAGSVSISRFEGDPLQLRTLINVGDLGPGEERLPVDEVYQLRDYPRLLRMFECMEPHRTAVDDPRHDATERELLASMCKSSSVAVPIAFGDRVWGELYATRAADEPQFVDGDMRFLQAIAGQLAAAVGRAEMYARLEELAFEDSLTGLANRRALDEGLDKAVAVALRDGIDLAFVLCDVDNLKEINDDGGHHAGDAALVRVAALLRDAAAAHVGSMVARLGGDEFCLVLPGVGASGAREIVEGVLAELVADGPRAAGLSAGIASIATGARRPADLVRAADAALYTAKRSGRGRVFVARSEDGFGERPPRERRAQPSARLAGELHRLLAETLQELDALQACAIERLSLATQRIAGTADSQNISISHSSPGEDTVRTIRLTEPRVRDEAMPWLDVDNEVYTIADYPATAAIMDRGGSFAVHADDQGADPDEVMLLLELGARSVAAVAVPYDGGCWLVELYGDDASADPALIEPYLRVLVHEAVRGALSS